MLRHTRTSGRTGFDQIREILQPFFSGNCTANLMLAKRSDVRQKMMMTANFSLIAP